MIVEDHESSIDPDEVSKSQRKRDADAVRELGEQLAALSPSELNTIPLADDVLSAIQELQRINCLLYTSPSPRDGLLSRMPSSA